MSKLRRLVPSLNALMAFETAARCGTFAKAAEELGVTPPAVSRMIARLEHHLGTPLFHRTATGVALTESGSMLYDSLSESFGQIEKVLARIAARRKEAGVVVLSVSSAFANHWFMPRLSRFQEHFPKVDIRFQLINGPLAGPVDNVDIAMRFDYRETSHYVCRPLMPEIVLPIRSPHFDVAGDSAPGAFLGAVRRIINLSEAQPDWSGLFAGAHGGAHASPLSFSDYTVVVQAALLGQGVALGWLNVVSYWLATGVLVPAGVSAMATGRRCQLITARPHASKPEVPEICEWIESELHSDLAKINEMHPDLLLPDFVQGGLGAI